MNTSILVGTWKLNKYEIEIKDTGELIYSMGRSPTGYVIFTSTGYVMVTLTGENRQKAQNDSEKAQLLNTLVAYAGRYRIENSEWVTSVEVAWNPEWVGTEQRRHFEFIENNQLHVTTTWRLMPNWADKGQSRSHLYFEKTNN